MASLEYNGPKSSRELHITFVCLDCTVPFSRSVGLCVSRLRDVRYEVVRSNVRWYSLVRQGFLPFHECALAVNAERALSRSSLSQGKGFTSAVEKEPFRCGGFPPRSTKSLNRMKSRSRLFCSCSFSSWISSSCCRVCLFRSSRASLSRS